MRLAVGGLEGAGLGDLFCLLLALSDLFREVQKGNVQLREAKRRAKDSRMFILLFLIGASLSLLFLHYY